MAHCKLLFVGTQDNLQEIFNNTSDSSSESSAEMTIGADWVNWDDEAWGSGEFTKYTKETRGTCHLNYKDVIEGKWFACYDIRNPNRYGSFDCINCPDFEPYVDDEYWKEREVRNKVRTIEAIKKLPDNTIFFFADSHW